MKITCTACKCRKGVRPDVLEKRIRKAGGYYELVKSYLCLGCRPKRYVRRKRNFFRAIRQDRPYWQVPVTSYVTPVITSKVDVLNFWEEAGWVGC